MIVGWAVDMSFYSQTIFPRLCDLILGRSFVARHRQKLLKGARGEVLEIGSSSRNDGCQDADIENGGAAEDTTRTNSRARRN